MRYANCNILIRECIHYFLFLGSYARAFSTDWHEASFSPALGEDEREQNLQAFIPMRKFTLDGRAVGAGADLWDTFGKDTPDGSYGNFYFRMTLPHNLTTTYTNEPVDSAQETEPQGRGQDL